MEVSCAEESKIDIFDLSKILRMGETRRQALAPGFVLASVRYFLQDRVGKANISVE